MSAAPPPLDELRRRVRADPGSHSFLGLAEALARSGEAAEALAVLDAGLAARPGHVAATVARARCLLELGREGEARDELATLLERDSTHLVAAKLVTEAHLRLGEAGRARAALAAYRALAPGDPQLAELERRVAGLEARAQDAPGAGDSGEDPAEPAADGDHPDEVVTVTLGELYLLQGHRAEAERIFRRVLRADPDNAAARQALARVLAAGPGRGRQDV